MVQLLFICHFVQRVLRYHRVTIRTDESLHLALPKQVLLIVESEGLDLVAHISETLLEFSL